MNSILFIFGFCLSILGVNVANNIPDQPQTVILTAPFLFVYIWGDYVNVRVEFYNLSPSVIYKIYKADFTTSKVIKILKNDADVYSLHDKIVNTQIYIYIELSTKAGWCKNMTILEGIAVDRLPHPEPAHYNPCSGYFPTCTIEMDLKNACTGPPSVSTTVKTVVAEKSNNNTFMSNASTSSHENIDRTTIKSTTSDTNVNTSNNTVIIIGSLSGITLILIAIIAIWKSCWMKHSPQGTPDLPTNQNHEPFYVNLLFRRECAAEIAELEQHHYEEINPQVSPVGS